jgi:hypothetical protein
VFDGPKLTVGCGASGRRRRNIRVRKRSTLIMEKELNLLIRIQVNFLLQGFN